MRAGTGFWCVAVAFAVLMAFGTAPTPLWPHYAARDGFGETTVTLVFSGLVVGTALSLLTVGHLSDRFGRRRTAAAALAVATAAALTLALWPALPGLFVGRIVNGVAIGLMAGTATSYLFDLNARARPDGGTQPGGGARLAAVVATAANLGGLALGPLAAGLVAQWAADPLLVVQAGFAVALAVCLALVARVPETVDTDAAGRPPRFALRPGGRVLFGSAGALAFTAFALFGLFTSLGSSVSRELGVHDPLPSALPATLMFAGAAGAQIVLDAAPWARQLAVGAVVFPLGLACAATSVARPSFWLYLLGATVAGAGAGLLFRVGLTRSAESAQPSSRAGVMAVFYTIAYFGMGIPSVLFAVIVRHVAVASTMAGFAAAIAAAAVTAALTVRRR
ncbi:MFS transporter [Actinomadura atramentaria]|uniref:MFS transporter n=1 Tax=Actinomadura atramentaria TaxID=1990 RepID=UPI000375B37A|nr:MFS transporter [Actinomadura atramentaria]